MPKRRRRTFTAEFKAQIVLEVLTGLTSQGEVARQHKLKPERVARWKWPRDGEWAKPNRLLRPFIPQSAASTGLPASPGLRSKRWSPALSRRIGRCC